jgi:hypothetical protein
VWRPKMNLLTKRINLNTQTYEKFQYESLKGKGHILRKVLVVEQDFNVIKYKPFLYITIFLLKI